MTYESHNDFEIEPSALPEGSIELHGSKEITEPQHLSGPLAERLSLLGAEQYKVIVTGIFETFHISAEDIESITSELHPNKKRRRKNENSRSF
jgi:hypothetical protein